MLVASSMVGLALYRGFQLVYVGYNTAMATNQSVAGARDAMDILANHVRNASVCNQTSGCNRFSVLDQANETGFTYYINTAGGKTQYYYAGGTLYRSSNGTTTAVLSGLTSLSISYFKCTTYHGTWLPTTNPNAPATLEMPSVAGIVIRAVFTQDGVPTTIATTIRMRNAPRKTRLDGV